MLTRPESARHAEPARRSALARVPLLLWVVVLCGVVVGAVVGVAQFDDAWAVVVAVTALLAATLTVVIVARDELAEVQAPGATRILGVRRSAAGVALAAVAALAIAAFGESSNALGTSTSPATAATAVRTVRDFVVAAGLDHDGEAACGFLTNAEQTRVSTAAGAECRQVFDDGTTPIPDAATGEGGVRSLPAAVTVGDGRATVRLGTGNGAVRFVLVRATPGEQNDFNAPASAWRIDAGATSLGITSRY